MNVPKLDSDVLRQHKGVSFVGVATCFFCHDGKGKFVMALRSQNARDEKGVWDIGGGGLKWGVTAEDNVRREVEEEYGTTPLALDFLGYREVFRTLPDGTKTHWITFDYAALVNPKEVRINEPETFDDIGWFTLDTLPAPRHSQEQEFFDQYKAQLQQILTV